MAIYGSLCETASEQHRKVFYCCWTSHVMLSAAQVNYWEDLYIKLDLIYAFRSLF